MWYRIHHYAADVAAAAAAFPTMPILVAHSMGGLVVQRLLEEHTFPAVVLLAPVPVGGAWGATARAARRHPGAFLGANLRLRLWPIVGTEQRARNHLFSADLPEEEVRRHHKRLGDESWMAYIDMLLFARPRPSRVTAPPMLVLAGEDDALFSVKEEAATARAYGADFVTVPGLAHDVMLDTRWPEAAAIVATWLESRFSPAVASP
jgi:pimeloyl-ACP methyl ester carboxylesterase